MTRKGVLVSASGVSSAPLRGWSGWVLLALPATFLGLAGTFGGCLLLVLGPDAGYVRGGRLAGLALVGYSLVCLLLAVRVWRGRAVVREGLLLGVLLLPGQMVDRWLNAPHVRWVIPVWGLALLAWLLGHVVDRSRAAKRAEPAPVSTGAPG